MALPMMPKPSATYVAARLLGVALLGLSRWGRSRSHQHPLSPESAPGVRPVTPSPWVQLLPRLAPLPAAQTCCCWLHLRLCCRLRRCGVKLRESACIVSLCATAMFPTAHHYRPKRRGCHSRIALLALDIADLWPRPSRTVILF
jgi:hypothetical protein